jgi:acyl-CoA thioester hydrolase
MVDSGETLPDPARVVMRRRIEWIDTDAAGIYHFTTAFRLAEAAEALLHTRLGIADLTFGATPRIRVAADFRSSLRFNALVDVELAVRSIGRTSLTYRFTITSGEAVAAEGEMVVCCIDRESGRPVPWGDAVRGPLASGGLVSAEEPG